MKDVVNKPAHYQSGEVECIDAIMAAVSTTTPMAAVLVGNIIKYVWRYKLKNGIEDLRKAEWYLRRLIELESRTDD